MQSYFRAGTPRGGRICSTAFLAPRGLLTLASCLCVAPWCVFLQPSLVSGNSSHWPWSNGPDLCLQDPSGSEHGLLAPGQLYHKFLPYGLQSPETEQGRGPDAQAPPLRMQMRNAPGPRSPVPWGVHQRLLTGTDQEIHLCVPLQRKLECHCPTAGQPKSRQGLTATTLGTQSKEAPYPQPRKHLRGESCSL